VGEFVHGIKKVEPPDTSEEHPSQRDGTLAHGGAFICGFVFIPVFTDGRNLRRVKYSLKAGRVKGRVGFFHGKLRPDFAALAASD
jgi:hypothetical protein